MSKLVSSTELSIELDKRFKVNSVSLFIEDFNLLSCELDNFTLLFYINIILKLNEIIILSLFDCE